MDNQTSELLRGGYVCFIGKPLTTNVPGLVGYLEHMVDQGTLNDDIEKIYVENIMSLEDTERILRTCFGNDDLLLEFARQWADENQEEYELNPWMCRTRIADKAKFDSEELPRLKKRFGKTLNIHQYRVGTPNQIHLNTIIVNDSYLDRGIKFVSFRDKKIDDEQRIQEIGAELFRLIEENPDNNPPRIYLDCQEIDFFPSAMLGRFITADKKLRLYGKFLGFINLKPKVFEVFCHTRLNRYFDIKATRKDCFPKSSSH